MKKAHLSNFIKLVILNLLFLNSILNNSLGWAQSIQLGYQNLVLKGPLTKKLEPKASPSDIEKSKCDTWQLHPNDLEGILEKMTVVSPVEWNAICYNYPCTYTGKVSNGQTTYDIRINAASYVILENKEQTLIFAAKEKLPIFITACNCCE